MTQTDLFTPVPASAPSPRGEGEKPSRTQLVAEYFKARPGQWIDGMVFAEFAGQYAWRSRVSDCRTQLGMNIENRLRTVRDHEFDCPGLSAWDMPEACRCGQSRHYTVSEYRFVPSEAQQG